MEYITANVKWSLAWLHEFTESIEGEQNSSIVEYKSGINRLVNR